VWRVGGLRCNPDIGHATHPGIQYTRTMNITHYESPAQASTRFLDHALTNGWLVLDPHATVSAKEVKKLFARFLEETGRPVSRTVNVNRHLSQFPAVRGTGGVALWGGLRLP